MNVKNCRNCGRIFNYVAGAILCQGCREEMEIKFHTVKEYIREHPGVSIPEVSEACDVETSQIRQWLREERLEVTEDSAIFLNCDGCGAPIRCGKYCDKCKMNLATGMKTILDEEKAKKEPQISKNPRDNARMRFL